MHWFKEWLVITGMGGLALLSMLLLSVPFFYAFLLAIITMVATEFLLAHD